MERYYLNRWERVIDLRMVKEVVTTTRSVDGVLQSVEEQEVTWKVATMETDYATWEMQYKGRAFSAPSGATYFGPKAARIAIDDAKDFCRSYRIERGDPLVIVVYSWAERVECKSHFDDEIWYRTDKPVEESPKEVVWASADQ